MKAEIKIGEQEGLLSFNSQTFLIENFKDTSVLHDSMLHLLDAQHVFEALFEEVGLYAEGPTIDVGIVIL